MSVNKIWTKKIINTELKFIFLPRRGKFMSSANVECKKTRTNKVHLNFKSEWKLNFTNWRLKECDEEKSSALEIQQFIFYSMKERYDTHRAGNWSILMLLYWVGWREMSRALQITIKVTMSFYVNFGVVVLVKHRLNNSSI